MICWTELLLFICYCKHWAYYIDVDQQERRIILPIMRSHEFPVSAITEQQTHPVLPLCTDGGWRLMPGSWRRLNFLFAISGVMYSADLLLHLVYLATEILNQVHISHGQGQHFSLVQSQEEAGGTLFSSRCWGAAPSIGSSAWADTSDLLGQLLQLVMGSISCANIKTRLL